VRVRFRERYTDEQLAAIYARPWSHEERYPDCYAEGTQRDAFGSDHLLRLSMTSALASWMYDGGRVADLSCGDAAVARALTADPILGDFAPGYPICGPIEQTILDLEPVDLFICTETLEHLDDPDSLLAEIRKRTRLLVLSTPFGETTDAQVEHYWGWDDQGVGDMLATAGFTTLSYARIREPRLNADYQLWGVT
jgi:hypothetical protein